MRDPRFLPVEFHEPMDESDDEFLSDEELYEEIVSSGKSGSKKFSLYIAS